MIPLTILAAAFIVGVMAGMAALLRLGIGGEESRRSLRRAPRTRSAAATRRVLGLYASAPRDVSDWGSTNAQPAAVLRGPNHRPLAQRPSPRQLPAAQSNRRWSGAR